jgi:TFIIF-interacting CTD phosphatase-like protein
LAAGLAKHETEIVEENEKSEEENRAGTIHPTNDFVDSSSSQDYDGEQSEQNSSNQNRESA